LKVLAKWIARRLRVLHTHDICGMHPLRAKRGNWRRAKRRRESKRCSIGLPGPIPPASKRVAISPISQPRPPIHTSNATLPATPPSENRHLAGRLKPCNRLDVSSFPNSCLGTPFREAPLPHPPISRIDPQADRQLSFSAKPSFAGNGETVAPNKLAFCPVRR